MINKLPSVEEKHDVDQLWTKTSTLSPWKPNWLNAKDQDEFGGWYGSDDVQLEIENEIITIRLGKGGTKFIFYFALIFIPFFWCVIFWMESHLVKALILSCLGTLCGVGVFLFTYFLTLRHEEKGDYLKINLKEKSLHLPRQDQQFSLSDVVTFQWIQGPSQNSVDSEIDFNLLIRHENELIRYHIMGNPARKMIEKTVAITGIPLEELKLKRKSSIRYRKDDRNTVST